MSFFGNTEKIQPTITYTVTKDILEIIIPKRDDVDLSKIYNSHYFEQFGLKVMKMERNDSLSKVESKVESKVDSNFTILTSLFGNKTDITSDKEVKPVSQNTSPEPQITDVTHDILPNIKSEQELEQDIKEKGLEEVILGKKESDIGSGYNVLPLHNNNKNDSTITSNVKQPTQDENNTVESHGSIISIKLKKGQTVIGLKEYQEKMEEEYGKDDMLTVSGLKYDEIERIVEDTILCMKEYSKHGKRVVKLDRNKMLKISERILLLECVFQMNEITEEVEKKDVVKEVLKECGIKEEDIKGTRFM